MTKHYKIIYSLTNGSCGATRNMNKTEIDQWLQDHPNIIANAHKLYMLDLELDEMHKLIQGGDCMDDMIIKKINYALLRINDNGVERIHTVYGKSNINQKIKELVDKYNLQNSANIEVKVITERRAISLEKFLQNSIVIK